MQKSVLGLCGGDLQGLKCCSQSLSVRRCRSKVEHYSSQHHTSLVLEYRIGSRQRRACRRVVQCANSGGDSEAFPMNLSLADAYKVLGLRDGATYEQVLGAKNKLLEECQGDQERKMQIEIAYDTIFSSQLKARLSGTLNVSNSVRFADVMPQKTVKSPIKSINVPNDLVTMRMLGSQDMLVVSGLYGALAAWTLVDGITTAENSQSIPGLEIALGVAAGIYFFRDKKGTTLPKAAILTLICLISGTLVGTLLESWLRVDVIPLGPLSSPGTVVGEFSLLGIYLSLLLLT